MISVTEKELLNLKAVFSAAIDLIDKKLQRNQPEVSTSSSPKGGSKYHPLPDSEIEKIKSRRRRENKASV